MASARYGRIYHSDNHHISLRFASAKARDDFRGEFEAYHSDHDHDGEAPRFVDITAQDANRGYQSGGRTHGAIHPVKLVVLSNGECVEDSNEQAEYVTINGYTLNEIKEYHNPEGMFRNSWYKMPTICVPPIIVIENKFVDSNILQRHPLSAIFGDMPDKDYQSLVKSVSKDGFIDNVIRVYEGQILDGWHRYCAGRELNLLRKLKFQEWHTDEHRDGDPKVFVLARNIERRHLSASQRAQIVVSFNERFQKGDIDSQRDDTPNGEPKTREELAKEAGVGTSTIDRAVAVEKEGESQAVIAGEKTAGEVIKARDAATAKKRKKQVLKNIWDTRIQAARDYTGDGDTDLNQYLTLPELEKGFSENNESYAEAFTSGMQRIDRAASFKDFQDRAFEVDEHGNAKVDISELEKEYRAIMTYSGDIRQWERPDWSPDTNYILPLIEAKKKSKSVTAEESEQIEKEYPKSLDEAVEPEDTVDSLWERIIPAISAWKAARKGKGLGHASKTMFISAIKYFDFELSRDSETDVVLLTKLLNVLTELHGPVHTFEKYIKMQLDGASLWSDDDDDVAKARGLAEFESQKRDLYRHIHETPLVEVKDEFGAINSDKALHRVLCAAYGAYDLDENLLWSEQAIEALSVDEIRKLTGKYFLMVQDLIAEPRPGWVAKLYQDVDASEDDPGLNDRMEKCRADLLQVWQLQDVYSWEGLEIELYVEAYGLSADVIAVMQSEIAAAHPNPEPCEPETESDEDTSLTEIDNLPAVKHFLESLLKQRETFIHPHDKDDFSISVFDALMVDSDLTERQQLLILIDCAYSIVMESESTSF